MEKIEIKVKQVDKLSNLLLNYGFSYNNINKLIRNKDIRINDVKINSDCMVMPMQNITIYTLSVPQNKFKIIFEDENVVVVDKMSGIEVEGEDGLEGKIKGAIAVHRLDRNTEGVLIMAKNKRAEEELSSAIKNQSFEKKYLAEVVGKTNFNGEKYSGYLVKDSKNSSVKVYNNFVQGSVKIETIFKTIKNGNETSIVEAKLITGKTHQIRAHLAFLGHAIVGDGKYGKNEDNKKFKEKKQKLHCYYLKINGVKGDLNYLNAREFISKPDWVKNINF